jgi:hypothetical protein
MAEGLPGHNRGTRTPAMPMNRQEIETLFTRAFDFPFAGDLAAACTLTDTAVGS